MKRCAKAIMAFSYEICAPAVHPPAPMDFGERRRGFAPVVARLLEVPRSCHRSSSEAHRRRLRLAPIVVRVPTAASIGSARREVERLRVDCRPPVGGGHHRGGVRPADGHVVAGLEPAVSRLEPTLGEAQRRAPGRVRAFADDRMALEFDHRLLDSRSSTASAPPRPRRTTTSSSSACSAAASRASSRPCSKAAPPPQSSSSGWLPGGHAPALRGSHRGDRWAMARRPRRSCRGPAGCRS